MESPTAASAAATVMTKNTATCPSILLRVLENVTNVRFTPFNISSIPIKITIVFLRRVTARPPRTKRNAPKHNNISDCSII